MVPVRFFNSILLIAASVQTPEVCGAVITKQSLTRHPVTAAGSVCQRPPALPFHSEPHDLHPQRSATLNHWHAVAGRVRPFGLRHNAAGFFTHSVDFLPRRHAIVQFFATVSDASLQEVEALG